MSDFEVHQESDAVASTAIAVAGIVAIAIGAIGVGVAGLLLAASTPSPRPQPNAGRDPWNAQAPPGGPISNVEQTPASSARGGLDLRESQARELQTWGWIDRDAGIAKIPIARAIDILVGRQAR